MSGDGVRFAPHVERGVAGAKAWAESAPGLPWDDDGRCNECGEPWKDMEYVRRTPKQCPNADCPSRPEPCLTPAEMAAIEAQPSATCIEEDCDHEAVDGPRCPGHAQQERDDRHRLAHGSETCPVCVRSLRGDMRDMQERLVEACERMASAEARAAHFEREGNERSGELGAMVASYLEAKGEAESIAAERDRAESRATRAEQLADALAAEMEAVRWLVEREAEPDVSYGAGGGCDPRDFHPDPECSTEEERAQHAADCERAAKGDPIETLRGCEDRGGVRVAWQGWGLGTYTVRNPEAEERLRRFNEALAQHAAARRGADGR